MRRLIATTALLPALVLPVGAGASPAAIRAAAPTVTAFTATATAIPIRIDVNDPYLPVEAEFDLAYTHAEGQSGPSGFGRASWLWPGDAIGTGLKQIADNSGLPVPPELTANGYPVQVNSAYPATNRTQASQADESAPGMVMRTSSGATKVVAKAAYSPDGEVPDDEAAPTEPAGQPGLPGLPGVPTSAPTAVTTAEDESPLGPLAALVDAGSMTGVSTVTYGGSSVVAVGSSRISDLSLLGGVVTADTIRVVTTTTSTLAGATTKVTSRVTGLAIAGHPFTVGKDGVTAEGQGTGPIPGLPDDAVAALETLGLRFEVPAPTRTVKGGNAALSAQGLRVTIDTAKLHAYLDQVPIDEVLRQFPPELSQWLGTAAHLAPEFIIDLGHSAASTAAIKVPDFCFTCTPTPPTLPGTDTPPPALPGSGLPPVAAPPVGVPPLAPVGTTVPPVDAALQPVAAGLPPLGSVPSLLILLALVVAGALGWALQRLGLLALGGGAAACTHGLETGVPDLRKA